MNSVSTATRAVAAARCVRRTAGSETQCGEDDMGRQPNGARAGMAMPDLCRDARAALRGPAFSRGLPRSLTLERMPSRWSSMRSAWIACALGAALCVACARKDDGAAVPGDEAAAAAADLDGGSVTISGDDSAADRLTWRTPAVDLASTDPAALRERARAALAGGRLYEDADAAVPIYLALSTLPEHSRFAETGLRSALHQLLQAGEAALEDADEDEAALLRALELAAVARTVDPRDAAVLRFLAQVDLVERVSTLNAAGEQALAAGDLGEEGGGALAAFRQALALVPDQPRASQGMAAVESALIRRAEEAALAADFDTAARWLAHATEVRPDAGLETV